jgi:hypothetical protein
MIEKIFRAAGSLLVCVALAPGFRALPPCFFNFFEVGS